eukprot:1886165-Amphidinium_carterae.1
MNWRQFIHKSSASIPEETAVLHCQNFNEKIRYFQHLHSVEDTRVYNIGETAVRMVPIGDRGWREKNQDAVKLGDSRQVTTVTLAMPLAHSEE